MQPFLVLLAAWHLLMLRGIVARETLTRSPAAQTGGVIALVLLCPAAWQAGTRAANADSYSGLFATLLLLSLSVAALLCAGIGVMARTPASVLRALPVPRGATLIADATGYLLSFPLLFLLASFVPLTKRTGAVGVVALLLLASLVMGFALFFDRMISLLKRRGRGGRVWLGAAALCFAVVLIRAAPASALAAVVKTPDTPVRLPWDPPPPPPPAVADWLKNTPPGLATQCLTVPRSASLALLVASTLLVFAAMLSLDVFLERTEATDNAGNPASNKPRRVSLFAVDTALLLQDVGAHVALRSPAQLMLMLAYAFIAPNLGNDAVQNALDLIAIGAILYGALWQMQFLCNRFGSDAGRAATLFSLGANRASLLVTKNAALFALLFAFDGMMLTIGVFVAGSQHLLAPILLTLPAILVLLTAIGNIVSVLSPFAIRAAPERYVAEPDRSLIFVYTAVGFATWALLMPVLWASQAGVSGYLLGAVYLAGIYGASVFVASRLLTPARERQIIARLDGLK